MHGVSTRYLQQLFARRNDCVSNCIRRERLLGCVLDLSDVKNSARSITEIAFTWGFNSASHFSATFKNEYGLTARDYRHCKSNEIPPQLREQIPGLLIAAPEKLIT
jgi:AraC-like DNA-binding protein